MPQSPQSPQSPQASPPPSPSPQPQAAWWTPENRKGTLMARCGLCFHACLLPEGKQGQCGVRNFDGKTLHSPLLGKFCSLAVDPIEKKPLYHWRPGSYILSLGSLGCTMRCPFCQNHSIAHPVESAFTASPAASGSSAPSGIRLHAMSVKELVQRTLAMGLDSVAYTYNEPTLQAEYILQAAPVLKDAGIATVLVSNGMYSEALLQAFAANIDAANIDYKCFDPKTYAKLGGSLDTVRQTIAGLLQKGVHVEVTTLIVPGISDNPEAFADTADWLAALSPDIPLHISRYRPAYKYTAPPTNIDLMRHFASIAKARLNHVHLGNVPKGM